MAKREFDRQVLKTYYKVVVKDDERIKIYERWELVSWNGGRPQFEMRRFIINKDSEGEETGPEKVYKLVALKPDMVPTFDELWPQIRKDLEKGEEEYDRKKKKAGRSHAG